jgi:hypothetical protein
VTTCRASAPSATSASCDAALAFKQGIVEISFTEKQGSSNINGLVTGGSGIYDHARGTVSITEGSNSDGPSTAIWTLRLIY